MPLDNEQKFWISVWALLALFLAVCVVCVTALNVNSTNVKAELLAKNVNALQIKCATGGNLSECQGITQDSIAIQATPSAD